MIGSSLEERQREQARAWLNRLQDAHSAADREDFAKWLAENPAHQRAYDAVSASYAEAGVLRTSAFGQDRNLERAFSRRRISFGGALAAAAAAAFLVLLAFEFSHGFVGLRPMPLESVMLSSGAEGRTITLADGSGLELAPSSEVKIELGRTKRLALVRRGHIHISIARESRPFLIVAGTTTSEASEGSFEAAMDHGQGTITPSARGRDAGRTSAGTARSAAQNTIGGKGLEFSGEPLGQAIARINAAGAGPLIEIDPRLANLRVTGVFQQGSSDEIARSLAVAFDLELTATRTGTLKLAR